ncbi:retron St85 family RNA-directed DNA polymerase [Mesorhizobium sp. MSK_1335]|uniref:RNA-directed DNA polymerase n=1 Tax=Mesorhizobium montanum TaxID=3072323 RepID=A0ABU4ZIK3_9HYPH|nr:retron St85 family RNA-directed DNA polymerase [Mesorhizobium sp. MSK_1335]MDX8524830.1 retron St85 family RNA-directed DNA polymerase [Mesorhizobium sp. MSK_1335]
MPSIVESLAIETGLLPDLVERVMITAPVRYKNYQIDKKGGGKRSISQPAREVKLLQRALIEILLRDLPVHSAATAYQAGLSIHANAVPHVGHGPILKMDFKDFFPTIRDHDWEKYCRSTQCLSDREDIRLTGLLICQRPKKTVGLRLAIGAPSSPFVSNALLYEFDEAVSAAVAKDKVIYTRYADDLTFSAPRLGHLRDVEKTVRQTLKGLHFPRLKINEDKTTYITAKFGRRVTGLTLTNDGKVSIGHVRKRLLHAQVHRASRDMLNDGELMELKGMLGFVNSVEPSFLDVLRRRYGLATVVRVQRFETVPPAQEPSD